MSQAKELAQAIHFFSDRGWVPATSSNFSYKADNGLIAVSQSGVDKSVFDESHFLMVDLEGKPVEGETRKPSAETLIHTTLYQAFDIGCVMHTHSPYSTFLSMHFSEEIIFEGYEILKALENQNTHEAKEVLPIYPNTQDMNEFSSWLKKGLESRDSHHAFLIAGHGMYTWGKDVFSTKRQVEATEFLLHQAYLEMQVSNGH